MMHPPAVHTFLDIVQAASEPIIAIDSAQRIIVFNTAAEEMFLLSCAQAIGKKLSILIPAPFRTIYAEHFARLQQAEAFERGTSSGIRLWGLRANGEEFPAEASCSPITTATQPYLAIFLHETTERRQFERALRASRDELTRLSNALLHAREEEKKRIAQELHDDIGQVLTALSMELSQLQRALPSAPAEAAAHVLAMRNLIKSSVTSLRRIASDLRPAMLDDLGLAAALEWLVSDFVSRYGIKTELHIDLGKSAPSNRASTTFFRVIQESLTNIARHAHATQVEIVLFCDGSYFTLTVQDNGIGAELEPLNDNVSTHLGLPGIRERVRMLDGSVSIKTRKHEGLRLEAHIPAKPPNILTGTDS